MKKRKILALLLALLLCVTPLGTAPLQIRADEGETGETAGAADDDELLGIESQDPIVFTFETVAENSRLALGLDKKEGVLQIRDKQTGAVWQSSSDGYNADETASGLVRNNMGSQLIAKYIDRAGNITAVNSRTECVRNGKMTVESIDNGVRITYHFNKPGFVIPVEYTLTEDAFQASVLTSRIQEEKDSYRMYSVTLLPYFGAGSSEDEGYMFVPDGSGALIRFNNGQQRMGEYSQDLYGRDGAIALKAQGPVTQNALLPVFGVKRGENGFAAIITEGEARARLNAHVSGVTDSYNAVSTEFLYRNYDSVVLKEKNWDSKSVKVFEETPAGCDSFTVRYCFLDEGAGGYTGMALRYQRYLVEEKGVGTDQTYDTPPFYLELFGSLKKTKYLLGIPYTATIPLTTYADAAEIVKALKAGGVEETVLNYDTWSSNSTDKNVPTSLALSGKLGGKKAFSAMADVLSANGAALFCDLNLTDITVSRLGCNKKWDGSKALQKTPAMQYSFLPNTYDPDPNAPVTFLLMPSKMQQAANTAARNLKKLPVTGLSANSLSQKLYSDFNKQKIDRTETERLWAEALATLRAEKGALMTSAANAYAFPASTVITDPPVDSSRFFIEDETVPFYQIALHGVLPMSIPSINFYSDSRECLLKAIETGVGIKYIWTARNAEEFVETSYAYLNNTDYRMWIDDAVAQQKELSSALDGLGNQRIVGHASLQDGVTRTVYEDGTVVYVNYNDSAVTAEGHVVEAKGYTVV